MAEVRLFVESCRKASCKDARCTKHFIVSARNCEIIAKIAPKKMWSNNAFCVKSKVPIPTKRIVTFIVKKEDIFYLANSNIMTCHKSLNSQGRICDSKDATIPENRRNELKLRLGELSIQKRKIEREMEEISLILEK